MRKLIVASTRRGAGKTSVIVGMGQAAGKKLGYLKPFGDRLLYRKKRLWDYDAALIAQVFRLEDNPEDMSLGFDHSKLRFMYDAAKTRGKLQEMLARVEKGKDVVLLEAGKDIAYGASVHLDALSLARHTGASLLAVLSGEEGEVLDDAVLLKQRMDTSGVDLAGVIVNREDGAYLDLDLFCRSASLPTLLRIPFDRAIAVGIAQGKTLVEIHPEYGEHFSAVFSQALKHAHGAMS